MTIYNCTIKKESRRGKTSLWLVFSKKFCHNPVQCMIWNSCCVENQALPPTSRWSEKGRVKQNYYKGMINLAFVEEIAWWPWSLFGKNTKNDLGKRYAGTDRSWGERLYATLYPKATPLTQYHRSLGTFAELATYFQVNSFFKIHFDFKCRL